MRYIHKTTRAIIDSPCVISGGQWILEDDEPIVENNKIDSGAGKNTAIDIKLDEDTTDSNTGVNLDDIKKKDIMQELDALGIKYNPKDNKATLYALLG